VWTYAGYHQSPNRWLKGTTPKPIAWTAGIQYDGDLKVRQRWRRLQRHHTASVQFC
jgi:hypothetical protein